MDGSENRHLESPPRPPPRLPVWLSALVGVGVGTVILLNEALLAGTDRPNLIFAAAALIIGAGGTAVLERLRR
jgi:uncharacterized membrane protein